MLTDRQSNILFSLIREYIMNAAPVASETLVRRYDLGVSSATIRNEMGELERQGYIVQPYTSAGRVPSTKGYRKYVEKIKEAQLPLNEQTLIRHQFYQASKDIEEWIYLAAAILARMLHSAAIVSFPGTQEPRLKLIKLVFLEEFMALMLLVFEDRHFRQQTVFFDEPVSEESLQAMACHLTDICSGLTMSQIRAKKRNVSPVENMMLDIIINIMSEDRDWALKHQHLNGISEVLSQPEFERTEKAQMFIDLLERRTIFHSVLSQMSEKEKVRVVIGSENPESTMHDFSMVIGRYGMPQKLGGIIGVVGPTRMPYDRALSAIRFLSDTMSELICSIYG